MLCEKCKKNEATVHIKEFHGSVCRTMHLCNECAKQKNTDIPLQELGFNLAEVLFDVEKFAKSLQSAGHPQTQEQDDLQCPQCHWDTEKLKKSGGKLGCPECYNTFRELIKPAISQVQRGSCHLGKRPSRNTDNSPALQKAELKKLQSELQKFIAQEEYEAAALCRDRINALKELISGNGEPENKNDF